MRVSEKSLELNVGAEVLMLLRGPWGMRKAYLRGLTQREEHQEGVDFIAQLGPRTRIFAFQFKAPKGRREGEPYRFTIQRRQHEKLSALSGGCTGNVFYVLPYYVSPDKLQDDVPNLLSDTWLLEVGCMNGTSLFGAHRSRTVTCEAGIASINPEYKLRRALEVEPGEGIAVRRFERWYENLHTRTDEQAIPGGRKDSWLVRGLRVAIVQPGVERGS